MTTHDIEEEILIDTFGGYQYFLGPEYDGEIGWDDAKKWCESLGKDYELPNRLVMLAICMNKETSALLFPYSYYWTSTEVKDDASRAWYQYWRSSVPGRQCSNRKFYPARVRAVRRSRIEGKRNNAAIDHT